MIFDMFQEMISNQTFKIYPRFPLLFIIINDRMPEYFAMNFKVEPTIS